MLFHGALMELPILGEPTPPPAFVPFRSDISGLLASWTVPPYGFQVARNLNPPISGPGGLDPRFLTYGERRTTVTASHMRRLQNTLGVGRVASSAPQARRFVSWSPGRTAMTLSLQVRRFLTLPPARVTTSVPQGGSGMPQGNDFSDIDATETVTLTWDLAPWLGSGVTLQAPVTTACALRSGTDPSPASRLLATPQIVASPSSGKASQAVQQQVSGMQTNARYFLTCTAATSDSQALTLWSHIFCKPET